MKEKVPNISELRSKLKFLYNVEEYIAMKNNKIQIFERRWTPLNNILP